MKRNNNERKLWFVIAVLGITLMMFIANVYSQVTGQIPVDDLGKVNIIKPEYESVAAKYEGIVTDNITAIGLKYNEDSVIYEFEFCMHTSWDNICQSVNAEFPINVTKAEILEFLQYYVDELADAQLENPNYIEPLSARTFIEDDLTGDIGLV